MRIQILPLPPVMVGDNLEEPFALIVDQAADGMDEDSAPVWERFKTAAGARAILVTASPQRQDGRTLPRSAQVRGVCRMASIGSATSARTTGRPYAAVTPESDDSGRTHTRSPLSIVILAATSSRCLRTSSGASPANSPKSSRESVTAHSAAMLPGRTRSEGGG